MPPPARQDPDTCGLQPGRRRSVRCARQCWTPSSSPTPPPGTAGGPKAHRDVPSGCARRTEGMPLRRADADRCVTDRVDRRAARAPAPEAPDGVGRTSPSGRCRLAGRLGSAQHRRPEAAEGDLAADARRGRRSGGIGPTVRRAPGGEGVGQAREQKFHVRIGTPDPAGRDEVVHEPLPRRPVYLMSSIRVAGVLFPVQQGRSRTAPRRTQQVDRDRRDPADRQVRPDRRGRRLQRTEGPHRDLEAPEMRILDPALLCRWRSRGLPPGGPTPRSSASTSPQPNYPFTFVQGDALAYAAEHIGEFDFVHASPPCQVHSTQTADRSETHRPDPADTRDPCPHGDRITYVIENGRAHVRAHQPGAPMRIVVRSGRAGIATRDEPAVRRFTRDHARQTPRFRSLRMNIVRGATVARGGVHGHINYAGEFELRCGGDGDRLMTNAELTQAIPRPTPSTSATN